MAKYSVLSTQHRPPSRSPLYHWHAAHGARLVESDGWQIPAVYTNTEEEQAAGRSGIGIADLSALGKITLQGPGVAAATRELAGGDAAARPGSVTPLAADRSTLACRLGEDQVLLLGHTTDLGSLERKIAGVADRHGYLQRDVTCAYAGFGLVGPHAFSLLHSQVSIEAAATDGSIGSCAQTALAGTHAIIVRAPGAMLPTVRVYVAWDLGEYVWRRLFDAGRRVGLIPIGLEAFRSLTEATE